MTGRIVLTVLLVACAALCLAKPLDDGLTWDEFVDMVKNVPVASKYDFVRDNYLAGYEIAHEEPLQAEDLTPDGKIALAIFTVVSEDAHRDVTQDRDQFILRDTICFPLPIGCIDSGDSGIRPT